MATSSTPLDPTRSRCSAAGGDRPDRPRAEEALGKRRRRTDARFADQFRRLLRRRGSRCERTPSLISRIHPRSRLPRRCSSRATAARRRRASGVDQCALPSSRAPARSRSAASRSRFCSRAARSNCSPNIVFANLDSDLPLYLWWQGEFPDPIDEQLWAWVDRLIFDSHEWARPEAAIRLAARLARASRQSRLILCDLNWTRTLHLRQALAQMFDHPENLAQLPRVQRLAIDARARPCLHRATLRRLDRRPAWLEIPKRERRRDSLHRRRGPAHPVRLRGSRRRPGEPLRTLHRRGYRHHSARRRLALPQSRSAPARRAVVPSPPARGLGRPRRIAR